MLLPIHIAAGGLAIVLGAVALSVKKGGNIHRRSGLLFVYAMVVMGTTAVFLGNEFGGLMTLYFVITALTTVAEILLDRETLSREQFEALLAGEDDLRQGARSLAEHAGNEPVIARLLIGPS